MESALGEAGQGPGVFAGQLVHHIALFQVGGHDLPGVGLHLEMLAEAGIGFHGIEHADEMVGRGVETAPGFGVQRDVEMDAPLGQGRARGRGGGGQGVVQIGVPHERSVGASLDHLMEVDVFGEGLKRLTDPGGGSHAQGVAQMDLAQTDAGRPQTGERLGGGFEFDGQVAAVVVHAQTPVEPGVSGAHGAQRVEPVDAFGGGLERAQGFGLKPQVQVVARSVGQFFEKVHALPELEQRVLTLLGRAPEGFVGDRYGADAAGHARRQQFGQDVEEPPGVLQPFRLGPVGGVHLFLDPLTVELPIREPVDGEHVGVVALQPLLERPQRGRFDEFPGGPVAEPEADGIGSAARDSGLHRAGVALQTREGLRPVLPAMDVGAIGQVQSVGQLHVRELNPG